MPSSWSDDFTTDNFTNGTDIYTLLQSSTEGTDFTVEPNDLTCLASSGVLWIDPRTPVTLPYQSTLAVNALDAAPYLLMIGMMDATIENVLLCGDEAASFTFLSIGEGDTAEPVSWTPPSGNFVLTVTIDVDGNLTITDGTTTFTQNLPSVADWVTANPVYPAVYMYGATSAFGPQPISVSEWTYGPTGPPPPPPRTLTSWIDPFITNNLSQYNVLADAGVTVDGSIYTNSPIGWLDDRAVSLELPASTFVRFYTGNVTPDVEIGWADDTGGVLNFNAELVNSALTVTLSCPGINDTIANSVACTPDADTMVLLEVTFDEDGTFTATIGDVSVQAVADSDLLAQLDVTMTSPFLLVSPTS